MSSLPPTQNVVLIDGISDGYDVIKYTQIETPTIQTPTDIIIKNSYAGVNFIESYFRKGLYPAKLPLVLGREASGVIVAIGSEVKDYKIGDKVAYVSPNTFAEYCKIPATHHLISKLPSDISEEQFKLMGSTLVQCLTAYTLAEEPYIPKPNEYVLVWAAAGGVGTILTQLLSSRGVNVIGLASTDEKLQFVKQLGAKHTINYKTENVVDQVKAFTNGKGVKVSYDSIGKATWDTSLECLGVGGVLVSYGNSSGKVDPINFFTLPPKNLMFLRPTFGIYMTDKQTWDYYFNKYLKDLENGVVKNPCPRQYPLKDYVEVTKMLESGKTTGKFLLEI